MASAGRPRTFDKEEALIKAMHVFWERGYEGTTMANLVDAIGIKAPSLYAAFGNKDSIFKEALLSYSAIIGNGQLKALKDAPNIVDAAEAALQESVELFSNKTNPNTCLIMTSAINTSPENIQHADTLREMRFGYKRAWVNRFQQAMEDAQLNELADANTLGEFFSTLIQGMAITAKDGASKEDLKNTAQLGLQCLKAFVA